MLNVKKKKKKKKKKTTSFPISYGENVIVYIAKNGIKVTFFLFIWTKAYAVGAFNECNKTTTSSKMFFFSLLRNEKISFSFWLKTLIY